MSDIFFCSHVYVFREISRQKVWPPPPLLDLMRLSLSINRQHPPNETGSQKSHGSLIEIGSQYQLRMILNRGQVFHVEHFSFRLWYSIWGGGYGMRLSLNKPYCDWISIVHICPVCSSDSFRGVGCHLKIRSILGAFTAHYGLYDIS